MILSTLSEMIWRWYQEGRAKSSAQTFSLRDVEQFARLAFANLMRQRYYEDRKMNEGSDFYYESPILSIKRFLLADDEGTGFRRIDMSEFDLYRLPHDNHIPNIYPIGSCPGPVMEITIVKPGEENFYRRDPQLSFFKFGVVKGRGINFYNIPPCVTSMDVESTYDSNDVDVTMDIAFDVANITLGTLLKMKNFPVKVLDNNYNPNATELKRRLEETQNQV